MKKAIIYWKNWSIKRVILIASLFFYLLDSQRNSRNRGETLILVFHHIDKPRRLKRFIEARQNLYRVISFDDWRSGYVTQGFVNVILSFDDGYSSWESAHTILSDAGIRGCLFFVCSGFVGYKDSTYCERIGTWREPAIEEDLLKEIGMKHWLGSHTDTHSLTEEDYRSIPDFCKCDRSFISRICEQDLSLFALVQGVKPKHGNPRDCGFDYVFSCDEGFLGRHRANGVVLPRTNVGLRSWILMLPVVSGHYQLAKEYYLKTVKGFRSRNNEKSY